MAFSKCFGPVACAVVAGTILAGCGHMPSMHWPWGHRSAAPPAAVNEISITSDAGTAAPVAQYWQRNTLVVDLHDAAREGSLSLKPRAGVGWPVRLAFRVLPGSMGVLEVQGEQRMILPVTSEGTRPIDLELVPGVYTQKTQEITVRWSSR